MLSSELYTSVVDAEKRGLSESSLRAAARNVGATYSEKALKKGLAYLDYNEPQNRCAYLYKYAVVHTGFVSKFFRKLAKKKDVLKVLRKKKDIKITCLGGGPGTDVVGIFKALSIFPFMHQKISRATILDLCVGWHNSFNYIMQHLISGKIKDVPDTFVREDFQAYFLEANLLEPLSPHTVEAIRNADIICMVKFISAVLGNKNSLKTLKEIANLFKTGAIILFIDNVRGNVSESVQEISRQAGLKIVMGPEVEGLHMSLKANRSTFGCEPLKGARVTVIGLMKTDVPIAVMIANNCQDSDDNWDTESEESSTDKYVSNKAKENSNENNSVINYSDQFTQTEREMPVNLEELNELVNALAELMSVMVNFKSKKHCCCNCNHH